MQQERPLWKILTLVVGLVVGLLGVAATLFVHFDTKHSTEGAIVEALSERYASVDKDMSYEQALEAVDKDIEKLKTDNATLQSENIDLQSEISSLQSEKTNLQSEISSLQSEKTNLQNEISSLSDRSEKTARAESYAALGNYEVAIPILNSITEKGEDVLALLKDYTFNYEISIIMDAEALANDGNFDEAITLVDEALKIIPNSQTLLEKKDDITPKYLVDTIECYKAENLWRLDSRDYIKMTGKSYRYAIFSSPSDIVGSMFNNAYSANAFYNLDGRYSQLTGIVGHIDFSGSGTIGENDAGQVYDAEITLWGDDKELRTITLSANDPTIDFNVPVTGVKILEFRIKCDGNSKVGIAEIQIR